MKRRNFSRALAHCGANLTSFKLPRYVEYRDALPKTPSEKVAKQVLRAGKPDLRAGSWGRIAHAADPQSA